MGLTSKIYGHPMQPQSAIRPLQANSLSNIYSTVTQRRDTWKLNLPSVEAEEMDQNPMFRLGEPREVCASVFSSVKWGEIIIIIITTTTIIVVPQRIVAGIKIGYSEIDPVPQETSVNGTSGIVILQSNSEALGLNSFMQSVQQSESSELKRPTCWCGLPEGPLFLFHHGFGGLNLCTPQRFLTNT